jgi:hypothetical protein
MSLILEALKKSEKSRHDAANSVLPLIVTPRRGRKRSGNSLPLVPIGIIVVALVVIALLMTFQDEEETEVVGINDEPVRTETAAPVVVRAPLPVETPRRAAPLPERPAVAEPVVATVVEPEPKTIDRNTARQEILQQAGILSPVDNTEVPPRLAFMDKSLRDSVSPLRLDFHVFSTDRRRRIVFLNGKEYREGDEVRNNLEVVRIVPEGTVMAWKNERFLLTIED